MHLCVECCLRFDQPDDGIGGEHGSDHGEFGGTQTLCADAETFVPSDGRVAISVCSPGRDAAVRASCDPRTTGAEIKHSAIAFPRLRNGSIVVSLVTDFVVVPWVVNKYIVVEVNSQPSSACVDYTTLVGPSVYGVIVDCFVDDIAVELALRSDCALVVTTTADDARVTSDVPVMLAKGGVEVCEGFAFPSGSARVADYDTCVGGSGPRCGRKPTKKAMMMGL